MIISNFDNTNFSNKDVIRMRKNLGTFLLIYLICNIVVALTGFGFSSFTGMLQSTIIIFFMSLGLLFLYSFIKACVDSKFIKIVPVVILIGGFLLVTVVNYIFGGAIFPMEPAADKFGYSRTFNPFITFPLILLMITYYIVIRTLISKKLKKVVQSDVLKTDSISYKIKNRYTDPTLETYSKKQLRTLNALGWSLILIPEILGTVISGLTIGLQLPTKMGDSYILVNLISVVALVGLAIAFVVYNTKNNILTRKYIVSSMIGILGIRVIYSVIQNVIQIVLNAPEHALLKMGLTLSGAFVLGIVVLGFYISLGKTLLANKSK